MKTVCLCILLAALLAVGGCATGQSYVKAGFDFSRLDKIAIIEVSGAVRGDAAKNQIGDFFGMELLKKGYTPVERAQVQALLEEQQFQASDITSAEGAARAGRILNVPTVMLVSIPTYKEEMSMTAKMVDVEDGSIIWMGSGSGTTGRTLFTIFGAAGGGAGGAQDGDDPPGDAGREADIDAARAGAGMSPELAWALGVVVGYVIGTGWMPKWGRKRNRRVPMELPKRETRTKRNTRRERTMGDVLADIERGQA